MATANVLPAVSNVIYQAFRDWWDSDETATPGRPPNNDENLRNLPEFQQFVIDYENAVLDFVQQYLGNVGQGYGLTDYLAIALQRNLAAQTEYGYALDSGQLYPDQILDNIMALIGHVNQVAVGGLDPTALPGYAELESEAARQYGEIRGNNNDERWYGGKYYINDGTAGNPYFRVATEKIDDEGMTEYQRRQNALDEAKFAEEQRQWATKFGYDQLQDRLAMEQSNQQAAWSNQLQQRQLDLQSQAEQRQEQERIAALKANPADWIEAWYAEHPDQEARWTNPNAEYSAYASAAAQDTRREMQRQTAQNSNPYGSLKQGQLPYQASLAENYADLNNKAAQSLAMAGGGNLMDYYQPAISRNPPTPGWLPKFAPSLTAGQEINPSRVLLASGQLWNQTPWSQRQGLGGYLKYNAGYNGSPTNLTDYEDYIKRNLPQRYNAAGMRAAGTWMG